MGVQINGDTGNISATKADYSGNVTIGGTLTYEDVTNIDSVGLITARNGIEVGARPGVAASISVDGNMIVSGITTFGDNIHAQGKIGINTDDPTARLEIIDSKVRTWDPTSQTELLVERNGNCLLSIVGGTSSNTVVNFGDADDENIGNIDYDHANNSMVFRTNASERARIESAGNVNVSQNLNVAGVVTATSFSGSGANLTGIVAIPSGGIILWSGAANAIPSGFVLCDGNNSTPDLRNRFVVGAGDSYAVDATGGATTDSVSISISGNTGQMYASGSVGGNQGAVLNSSSGHKHSFSGSGSATVDTLPPYYALCYIMKT